MARIIADFFQEEINEAKATAKFNRGLRGTRKRQKKAKA
jgi:hypothetical protein